MTIRQRSPNYPNFDLVQVLEDIERLYNQEKRTPVPPEVAVKAWGYKSLNGNARRRLASVRQYGLIDQQRNSGTIRLTDRALTLLLRNPATKEYQAALREAALEPSLFYEIYNNRNGGSDESLRHYLIVDKLFTEDGADRFIQVFRNTLRVANLDKDDIISGQEDGYSSDEFDDYEETEMQSHARQSRETPTYETHAPLSREHVRVPLRLMGGKTSVAIELPESMSNAAWTQMINMLNALKPGYVADEDDSKQDSEDESEVTDEEPPLQLSEVS